MIEKNRVDVIAFSPHPDDAEMGCGGLLLKMKAKGYTTGIVDLTRAELSTNGDPETRAIETSEASRILGLDIRDNLELEDGNIVNDKESRLKVIDVIRKYRPRLVLMSYGVDRHPDHENSFKLLKDAIFISGLEKFRTGLAAWRPSIVINYMLHFEFAPTFIVDITEYYDRKFRAVAAYRSQFYSDEEKKVMTFISSKYFFDVINSRHQCHGLKVMSRYGEPYYTDFKIRIDDPIKFFDYLA